MTAQTVQYLGEPNEELAGASAVLAALSSQLRLRIIRLLETGEHHVQELVAKLGKSQPLISQHLKVLKSCGIVESERHGRWVVYRLTGPHVSMVINNAVLVAANIYRSPLLIETVQEQP